MGVHRREDPPRRPGSGAKESGAAGRLIRRRPAAGMLPGDAGGAGRGRPAVRALGGAGSQAARGLSDVDTRSGRIDRSTNDRRSLVHARQALRQMVNYGRRWYMNRRKFLATAASGSVVVQTAARLAGADAGAVDRPVPVKIPRATS